MFLPYTLEIWRAIPTPLALVSTGPPPRLARIEEIDPFPAEFFPEDRAQFLEPVVHRAYPVRTRPLILIVGEAQPVIIFNALTGSFGGIFRISIIITKTRGFIGIDIQRRFTLDDPFRHEFTDTTCAAITIERHTSRDPHAADFSHRPKHGLAVRGVCTRMAYQCDDASLLKEWNPANGPFQ